MTPNAQQQTIIDLVSSSSPTDTLVIAGPGSGKTRTLVGSICALVKKDTKVADTLVAISFTNNSAAELKVRLAHQAKECGLPALHRVRVSTFHAWVAVLQARRVTPWEYAPILLKNAGLSVALDLKANRSKAFSPPELSAADRHLEGSETFEAMEEREFNGIESNTAHAEAFSELKSVVDQLETEMESKQIRTYGTLMKSGEGLASMLEQGEISWLFIDEAQDMNAPQGAFVDAVQAATGCKLFVIADDDQGIYKFRGASTAYLEDFDRRATTTRFVMEQNHRSTKPIVEACLEWIKPNWTGVGKKLYSERKGLPVVILKNPKADERAKHARWILEAAKDNGLLKFEGEACILGNSPKNLDEDVRPLAEEIHMVSDVPLDEAVLGIWLELLEGSNASGDWHHPLWETFIDTVKEEYPEGCPGLNDLYSTLEVVRRLAPDEAPADFAARLKKLNPAFLGDRPDPDYEGDKWNYVSFHSSKGMEFPVVWVTSGPFTYAVSKKDKQEGQPNQTKADAGEAAQAEKRRLLYVAMSRASDLLIISAPWSKGKANEEAFLGLISKLPETKIIYTDEDAKKIMALINAGCRNSTWERPKRYRMESYTSLTGQPQPGEVREVEIPKNRECPLPPSESAIIGDQFHRIMHLLCMHPKLLEEYQCCGNHAEVVSKVIAGDVPPRLMELVENYFSDLDNKPYELLANDECRSEVPFTVLSKDPSTGEEILVKGFIDLVRFDEDGNPDLILDYKTGSRPVDETSHAQQLEFYRDALAETYSVAPITIKMVNYYVTGQEWVER